MNQSALYQSIVPPQGFNPLRGNTPAACRWGPKIGTKPPTDLKRKDLSHYPKEIETNLSILPLQNDDHPSKIVSVSIEENGKKVKKDLNALIQNRSPSFISSIVKRILVPSNPLVVGYNATDDKPVQYQVSFGAGDYFTPADLNFSKWGWQTSISSKTLTTKDTSLARHQNTLFLLSHFNVSGKLRNMFFESEGFKPEGKQIAQILYQPATEENPEPQIWFVDNAKRKHTYRLDDFQLKIENQIRRLLENFVKDLEDQKNWDSWVATCAKLQKSVPEKALACSYYTFPEVSFLNKERLISLECKLNLSVFNDENGPYRQALKNDQVFIQTAAKVAEEMDLIMEDRDKKTRRISELEAQVLELRQQVVSKESPSNGSDQIIGTICSSVTALGKDLGLMQAGLDEMRKQMMEQILQNQEEQKKMLQELIKLREPLDVDTLFSQPTQDSLHSQPTQLYPKEHQQQPAMPRSRSNIDIPNLTFEPLHYDKQ